MSYLRFLAASANPRFRNDSLKEFPMIDSGWWFLILTILKNMSQLGRITSHILWKNKTCLKPPNQVSGDFFFLRGFSDGLSTSRHRPIDVRMHRELWDCSSQPRGQTGVV